MLILLILHLFIYIHIILSSDDSNILPMWSRGFAYSCCDIYPSIFMKKDRGSFLHGDQSDINYFYEKYKENEIKNGSIVYVVSSDLPDFFINVFIKLPIDHKIILVSGCEDIGVPYELFNPNRPYLDYNEKAMWPHGRQGLSIQSILQDNRLHKWYIQNYDLEGCNVNTCSTIKINDNIIDKLVPIPIGMDFHTFTSFKTSEILTKIFRTYQYSDYKIVKSWSRICQLSNYCRLKSNVILSFDCHFDNSNLSKGRQKARGHICDVINNKNIPFHIIERFAFENSNSTNRREFVLPTTLIDKILLASNASTNNQKDIKDIMAMAISGTGNNRSPRVVNRLQFWFAASMSKFGLAPAGFGTDTHRVWEILQFDCVPIVISSTLDKLYRQYPIIIVKSWEELTDVNHIESLYDDIITRFGDPPFNDNIRYQLTLDYWINKVKDELTKTFN